MKTLRLSISTVALLVLAACVTPSVKPWLWRDSSGVVPSEIVLARPITAAEGKGEKRLTFELPAGRYLLWYENQFAYCYRHESKRIRRTKFHGEVTEIEGGFKLAKRGYYIWVYRLISLGEFAKEAGELAHLSAWEQGDKDGLVRDGVANVPPESFPAFGFPSTEPRTQ